MMWECDPGADLQRRAGKVPGLKVCIAHGGGPACFAMGRLDRNWHDRPFVPWHPLPVAWLQNRASLTAEEKILWKNLAALPDIRSMAPDLPASAGMTKQSRVFLMVLQVVPWHSGNLIAPD